jgi:plastocyanin domain-containing protein
MLKTKFINLIVSFSLVSAIASSISAAEMREEHSQRQPQFQRIEQPLALKIGLTVGGLALISAQLWWFLFSKPKSQ